MPVPASIADLSTTPASNSPAGTDMVTSTTGPDDYIRALSAIIKTASNDSGSAANVVAAAAVTPADADVMPVMVSSVLKKVTWANVKATLKTYFDTLYASLAGATFTGLVKLSTGANIASSATIDLSTATGNLVHITGTTATSAVTMTAGQHMRCIADAAWPLTYNATTNRINGGVSYTCATGDTVDYFYDGSVVYGNITKKDGTAVVAGVTSVNGDTGIVTTLGHIQTYQNLTASRALGTTYTNSTGEPIYIIVSCAGAGGACSLDLIINTVSYSTVFYNTSFGVTGVVQGIVPTGATYSVATTGGPTLSLWAELRT